MIKKAVTYTDYDGNERTEEFFFNLTEAELTKMFTSVSGGLDRQLQRIVGSHDIPKVMSMFEEILRQSYGEKSADGRRFMKSDEIFQNFKETEAYSQIFMELCTDEEAAGAFISGVLPKDLSEKVREAKYVEDAAKTGALAMPASTQ